jgi:hypothetical protein
MDRKADASLVMDYFRDQGVWLTFRAGWIIHMRTGVRFRLPAGGAVRMVTPGGRIRIAVSDPEAGAIIGLFQWWYDELWRPARISDLLDRYKAPRNRFQHWLRRAGWRRRPRIPPTAEAVLATLAATLPGGARGSARGGASGGSSGGAGKPAPHVISLE